MKVLSAENVSKVFMDCLFRDEEEKENPVLAEGLTMNVGFNPKRLESHREDVKDFLMQLPHIFRENDGGGWSFLQACMTNDGFQWGEQRNAQELVLLGVALEYVEYLMPRKMWCFLPGGVPYFVIKGI